VGFNVI